MFIMTLSHPPEVNSDLCALKLFGRAECREELGLPHVGGGGGCCSDQNRIRFLKTVMGLVARKSITVNLEVVSTSCEVDMRFLTGAGCLFTRESPSLRVQQAPR